MGTLSSYSTSHLVRCRFILRPTSLPSVPSSFISKSKQSLTHPLQTATTSSFITRNPAPNPPFSTRRLFFSAVPLLHEVEIDVVSVRKEIDEINGDEKFEPTKDAANDVAVKEGLTRVLDLKAQRIKSSKSKLPTLTIKEKKELASYAHSLGKKIKSQQVGKSGVTGTVVTALIDTLEANEILKVKIHSSCPVELDDAVKQLEEATGAAVVSQIGRTMILYRPSLTKLKEEEEKKKRAQIFAKKQQAFRKASQSRRSAKVEAPERRQSGRGRRGSSRF